MRYVGQGYELDVPMAPDFADAFHVRHSQRYGYADPKRATEVVNVRLRAVGVTNKPPIPKHELEEADASAAVVGECSMVFEGSERSAQLIDRSKLRPGNRCSGPALVVEYSTTTVVPPDFELRVDEWENLVLEGRREK
jgi:N-methylhydantoinase A